jgi:hypothetical protein
MHPEKPAEDADPSGMTDFEKNATQEELERVVPEPESNGNTKEGNRGPDEEPAFGQGA